MSCSLNPLDKKEMYKHKEISARKHKYSFSYIYFLKIKELE